MASSSIAYFTHLVVTSSEPCSPSLCSPPCREHQYSPELWNLPLVLKFTLEEWNFTTASKDLDSSHTPMAILTALFTIVPSVAMASEVWQVRRKSSFEVFALKRRWRKWFICAYQLLYVWTEPNAVEMLQQCLRQQQMTAMIVRLLL